MVALAGGSTPRGAYAALAAADRESSARLPGQKIHVFFGDERPVPPNYSDSNYRTAREALLSQVSIPPENVHRIRGELDAQEAANQYQEELQREFHVKPGELPRFDLILLGMGEDGHTASLFPDSPALADKTSRFVVSNWVEKLKHSRITLTLPLLNHAAEVMLLVSGTQKAEILRKVLGGMM